MKCYLKPSQYKCKSCMKSQTLIGINCDCDKCSNKSKEYDILQFTDHGVILMDDNGDVFRKPFEDIRIIKEEGVTK